MDKHQEAAANLIQKTWRKHNNSLESITSRLKATHERVRTLEKYQTKLSLVHASRFKTWDIEQRTQAVGIISRWWRRLIVNKLQEKAGEVANKINGLVSNLLVEPTPEPLKIDYETLGNLIVSRLAPTSNVPDYLELDFLLIKYCKPNPRKSNNLGFDLQIRKIVDGWDSNSLEDLEFNAEGLDKIDYIGNEWWMEKVPFEDAGMDEWISKIEKSINN